jgi:hypothetical protein
MDKLTVPLINRAVDKAVEDISRRVPIIGQSLAGFRSLTSTCKSFAKFTASVSITKKCLYGTATVCSASSSVLFLGSAATSTIAPNLSIPLLATGEALLYAGCLIDGTADGITFIP